MLQRNIPLVAMLTQQEKKSLEDIAFKRGFIRSGKGNITQAIIYLINKELKSCRKK
jgi:hypothetical protein